MNSHYVVYDVSTGNIIRCISCSKGDLTNQIDDARYAIVGSDDISGISALTHSVDLVSGRLVRKPSAKTRFEAVPK